MLFDFELPKSFWSELVNTAIYLVNRLLKSFGKTLMEIWSTKKLMLAEYIWLQGLCTYTC